MTISAEGDDLVLDIDDAEEWKEEEEFYDDLDEFEDEFEEDETLP